MYGETCLFLNVVRIGISRKHLYSTKSTKRLLEFLANMPKSNSTRTAEAQQQRHKIAKKGEKYGPSTIYLQVLGSGARGASNALYLFTDQKRYLFNCGESTQRIAHEHKVKLSRLDHIFITSKTWKNIGGLPGLSLTLQDVGVPKLTLHGPEGLDELYTATKRFVIMKDLNVSTANCTPCEDFEDNVMSVKYVLLGPHSLLQTPNKQPAKKPKLDISPDTEFEEFLHDNTDYYRRDSVDSNKNVKPKPLEKGVDRDTLKNNNEKVLQDLQKLAHCSVAYICTVKKRLGTLDLEKCVEMGVKPGPMLGQLKSGQDVMLPDGRVVLSKDVKTPDDPGPVFIVLEVQDINYLKESDFKLHFDTEGNLRENIPALIVHYTPPHVFNHPDYQSFMAKFGATTNHLVLNDLNSCLGSEAVHRIQHKLHLLNEDIFPLLKDVSVPAVWNAHPRLDKTSSPTRLKGLEELKNKIALAQFQNIINMEGTGSSEGQLQQENKLQIAAGRTLTMFHLRPKREIDRSAEPKLHIQDYIEETMDVDGFVGSLQHFKKLVDSMRYGKRNESEFPRITFLGTGSCIPSKTRNTSAIVLQIDEQRSMLLDCGEGTFNQLVRFNGAKRVNTFLRTLKAIYVSHLHADHHIGLIGVLQARRQALDEMPNPTSPHEPVYLLAPGQIVSWLAKYDQQFESIRGDYTLIPNQNLVESKQSDPASTDLSSAVLASIGVDKITTCYVSHCPNAFGVAIQVDAGHKITYSGDTIPCDELVKIGKESTVLIHEATMEDELADEARIKMHSTTSQAIEIGRAMNARYTVLTHFSQRYSKLPRLNAQILHDNKSVGIAFDNMQITMSDLDLLPLMYAPLQLMFAEHCVELELKAAHRARTRVKAAASLSCAGTVRNYTTDCARSGDEHRADPPLDNGTPPSTEVTYKREPKVRRAMSLSTPKAKYRESNASMLRQESKGMSINGVVKPGFRSKSSSPAKLSENSANSTRSNSVSHSPNRNVDLKAQVTSKRETSPTSKISKDKCKAALTPVQQHVVDTRSKTINNATLATAPNEDPNEHKNSKTIKSQKSNEPPSLISTDVSQGYGRPLVTPIKQKLTIRREPRTTVNVAAAVNEDISPNRINRSRSPLRSWKAQNRQPPPSSAANKQDLIRSTLLIDIAIGILLNTLFWKAHYLVSCVPPLQWQIMMTVIAVTYLFWTANKTGEPKFKTPGLAFNTKKELRNIEQNGGATNNYLFKPQLSTRSESVSRRQVSADRKAHGNSFSATKVQANGRTSSAFKPNTASKLVNQLVRSGEPSRESLGSQLRGTIMKEIKPQNFIGRPNFSNQSSKAFKPQLEDIKSSFLLLNKKFDRNLKGTNNNGYYKNDISKPRPLDEEARRLQLLEAMDKFKSRRFLQDSRFDKIEGLNWISWK
ncbi:ribonuclease Z, mitochondrial isoform X5 [Leptidea sinapis]|uniref:ribonuclease Z, mitochondrial isoform X5 n=1 Tax=Leptidea sinapis TaxID=189913 RepID=UPI0021C32AE4|nr:ribonuclease Z, mitochondrial isoform X5 [Leptidea sinapis]